MWLWGLFVGVFCGLGVVFWFGGVVVWCGCGGVCFVGVVGLRVVFFGGGVCWCYGFCVGCSGGMVELIRLYK